MKKRVSFAAALALAGAGSGCKKSSPPPEMRGTPAPASAPAPAPPAPAGPAPAQAGKVERVALRLTSLGEDKVSGAPRSKVTLVTREGSLAPTTHELGEHVGCGIGGGVDPKALVGVSCFWAGAGDDVNVYHEGDELVVRKTPRDAEMKGRPIPQVYLRVPLLGARAVADSPPLVKQ